MQRSSRLKKTKGMYFGKGDLKRESENQIIRDGRHLKVAKEVGGFRKTNRKGTGRKASR